MTEKAKLIDDLYKTTDTHSSALKDPKVASLVVHHNEVLGAQLIPGLEVNVDELKDGIRADFRLKEGTIVKKPVHLCFAIEGGIYA